MSENSAIPLWSAVKGSDTFQSFDLEEKYKVFNVWEDQKWAQFGEDTDPEIMSRFKVGTSLLRDRIGHPEETTEETLGRVAERATQLHKDTYRRSLGSPLPGAYPTPSGAYSVRERHKHLKASREFAPDEEGNYTLGGATRDDLNIGRRPGLGEIDTSYRIAKTTRQKSTFKLGDDDRAWMSDNGLDDPTKPYQWTVRRLSDDPADPWESRVEVNYALAILGKEIFTGAIMGLSDEEFSEGDKRRIIANYDNYRAFAEEDLGEYVMGKEQGRLLNPDGGVFDTTTEYFLVDEEDGLLRKDLYKMFLDKGRLKEIRKSGKMPTDPAVADEIAQLWLTKRGLGEYAEKILGKLDDSELERAELVKAYHDALMNSEPAWDEDTVALQESGGQWRINPKHLTLEDDEIRDVVEQSGLGVPAGTVEGWVMQGQGVKDEAAIHWKAQADVAASNSRIKSAREIVWFWDSIMRDKGKEWEPRRIKKEYENWLRDPNEYGPGPPDPEGRKKILGMSIPVLPLMPPQVKNWIYGEGRVHSHGGAGLIGRWLQTWDTAEDSSWLTKPARRLAFVVGSGLRSGEEEIVNMLPEWGTEIGAVALTVAGSKRGPELMEGINYSRQASHMARTSWGVGGKYGGMLGKEMAVLGLTGGASSIYTFAGRKVSAALLARRASSLAGNTRRAKQLQPWAKDLATGKVLNPSSKFRKITDGVGLQGYSWLQASRSGTAMYSNAFLHIRDELLATGVDPEEAEETARLNAVVPALGATMLTYSLMKLMPGGTERFFTRGTTAHKTVTAANLKQASGYSPKEWVRYMKDPKFKATAVSAMTKRYDFRQMLGHGFVGGGVREAAEEFLDELGQGIIAMASYNPDLEWSQVVAGAAEAALVGGMLGSAVSGMQQRGLAPISATQLPISVQKTLDELHNVARELDLKGNTESAKAVRGKAADAINELNKKPRERAYRPDQEPEPLPDKIQPGELGHYITLKGDRGVGLLIVDDDGNEFVVPNVEGFLDENQELPTWIEEEMLGPKNTPMPRTQLHSFTRDSAESDILHSALLYGSVAGDLLKQIAALKNLESQEDKSAGLRVIYADATKKLSGDIELLNLFSDLAEGEAKRADVLDSHKIISVKAKQRMDGVFKQYEADVDELVRMGRLPEEGPDNVEYRYGTRKDLQFFLGRLLDQSPTISPEVQEIYQVAMDLAFAGHEVARILNDGEISGVSEVTESTFNAQLNSLEEFRVKFKELHQGWVSNPDPKAREGRLQDMQQLLSQLYNKANAAVRKASKNYTSAELGDMFAGNKGTAFARFEPYVDWVKTISSDGVKLQLPALLTAGVDSDVIKGEEGAESEPVRQSTFVAGGRKKLALHHVIRERKHRGLDPIEDVRFSQVEDFTPETPLVGQVVELINTMVAEDPEGTITLEAVHARMADEGITTGDTETDEVLLDSAFILSSAQLKDSDPVAAAAMAALVRETYGAPAPEPTAAPEVAPEPEAIPDPTLEERAAMEDEVTLENAEEFAYINTWNRNGNYSFEEFVNDLPFEVKEGEFQVRIEKAVGLYKAWADARNRMINDAVVVEGATNQEIKHRAKFYEGFRPGAFPNKQVAELFGLKEVLREEAPAGRAPADFLLEELPASEWEARYKDSKRSAVLKWLKDLAAGKVKLTPQLAWDHLYAKIREAPKGAYTYDAGAADVTGKETSEWRVQAEAIWHYRIYKPTRKTRSQKTTDRVSLNVDFSPELISKLDKFTAGNEAVINYKTPADSVSWSERHDPITIYLNKPLSKAQLTELSVLVDPHVRQGPYVNEMTGTRFSDGVFYEPSPQSADVEALITRAEKVDADLASALRVTHTKGKRLKASAASFAASKQLVEIYERRMAGDPTGGAPAEGTPTEEADAVIPPDAEVGDEIEIFNARGERYKTKITTISKESGKIKVIDQAGKNVVVGDGLSATLTNISSPKYRLRTFNAKIKKYKHDALAVSPLSERTTEQLLLIHETLETEGGANETDTRLDLNAIKTQLRSRGIDPATGKPTSPEVEPTPPSFIPPPIKLGAEAVTQPTEGQVAKSLADLKAAQDEYYSLPKTDKTRKGKLKEVKRRITALQLGDPTEGFKGSPSVARTTALQMLHAHFAQPVPTMGKDAEAVEAFLKTPPLAYHKPDPDPKTWRLEETLVPQFKGPSGSRVRELTKDFAVQLAEGVIYNRDQLASVIQRSRKFPDDPFFNEMDQVILLLMTYEALYTDTPAKVISSEAKRLAEAFGDEKSPGFVGGVLSDLLNNLKDQKPSTEFSDEVKDAITEHAIAVERGDVSTQMEAYINLSQMLGGVVETIEAVERPAVAIARLSDKLGMTKNAEVELDREGNDEGGQDDNNTLNKTVEYTVVIKGKTQVLELNPSAVESINSAASLIAADANKGLSDIEEREILPERLREMVANFRKEFVAHMGRLGVEGDQPMLRAAQAYFQSVTSLPIFDPSAVYALTGGPFPELTDIEEAAAFQEALEDAQGLVDELMNFDLVPVEEQEQAAAAAELTEEELPPHQVLVSGEAQDRGWSGDSFKDILEGDVKVDIEGYRLDPRAGHEMYVYRKAANKWVINYQGDLAPIVYRTMKAAKAAGEALLRGEAVDTAGASPLKPPEKQEKIDPVTFNEYSNEDDHPNPLDSFIENLRSRRFDVGVPSTLSDWQVPNKNPRQRITPEEWRALHPLIHNYREAFPTPLPGDWSGQVLLRPVAGSYRGQNKFSTLTGQDTFNLQPGADFITQGAGHNKYDDLYRMDSDNAGEKDLTPVPATITVYDSEGQSVFSGTGSKFNTWKKSKDKEAEDKGEEVIWSDDRSVEHDYYYEVEEAKRPTPINKWPHLNKYAVPYIPTQAGKFVFTNNPFHVAAYFSEADEEGNLRGPFELPRDYWPSDSQIKGEGSGGPKGGLLNPGIIIAKDSRGTYWVIGAKTHFPLESESDQPFATHFTDRIKGDLNTWVVLAASVSKGGIMGETIGRDRRVTLHSLHEKFKTERTTDDDSESEFQERSLKLIEATVGSPADTEGGVDKPDTGFGAILIDPNWLTPEEKAFFGADGSEQTLIEVLEKAWNASTKGTAQTKLTTDQDLNRYNFYAKSLLAIVKSRITNHRDSEGKPINTADAAVVRDLWKSYQSGSAVVSALPPSKGRKATQTAHEDTFRADDPLRGRFAALLDAYSHTKEHGITALFNNKQALARKALKSLKGWKNVGEIAKSAADWTHKGPSIGSKESKYKPADTQEGQETPTDNLSAEDASTAPGSPNLGRSNPSGETSPPSPAEASDIYTGEGASPFDGLTQKTRDEIARIIKQQIEELGLKDGDAESARNALLKIIDGAQDGTYPPQYGELAAILLASGEINFDKLKFHIDSNIAVAAYYQKIGDEDHITISDKKTNNRGVHDLLIHEFLHLALDELVTNPKTEAQRLAVEAIDAMIDRGRNYFPMLKRNRAGAQQRAEDLARSESTMYDLDVIKRLVAESDSPIAAEYDPGDPRFEEIEIGDEMESPELRNLFYQIRLEEYRAGEYQDDVTHMRSAFGINPDGSYRNIEGTRKEFIVQLLTDQTTQWYLKEIDKLSESGSLWKRLMRVLSKGITVDSPDEKEILLDTFLTLDGTENYIDKASLNRLRELAGSSASEVEAAEMFRGEAPAYSEGIQGYHETLAEEKFWEQYEGATTAPKTAKEAFRRGHEAGISESVKTLFEVKGDKIAYTGPVSNNHTLKVDRSVSPSHIGKNVDVKAIADYLASRIFHGNPIEITIKVDNIVGSAHGAIASMTVNEEATRGIVYLSSKEFKNDWEQNPNNASQSLIDDLAEELQHIRQHQLNELPQADYYREGKLDQTQYKADRREIEAKFVASILTEEFIESGTNFLGKGYYGKQWTEYAKGNRLKRNPARFKKDRQTLGDYADLLSPKPEGATTPARRAINSLGVTLEIDDSLDAPRIGSTAGTVIVPSKGEYTEKDLVAAAIGASFSAGYSIGARRNALRGLTENSGNMADMMNVLVSEAGTFEALMGDMVADAFYDPKDVQESPKYSHGLQGLRNEILSGNFGAYAARQMDTMMDATNRAFPNRRDFRREQFSETAFVGDRVTAARALRKFVEFSEEMHPDEAEVFPEIYAGLVEAAADLGVSIETMLDVEGEGSDLYREQVERVLQFQKDEFEEFKKNPDPDNQASVRLREEVMFGPSEASAAEAAEEFDEFEDVEDEDGVKRKGLLPDWLRFSRRPDPEREGTLVEGDSMDDVLDYLEMAYLGKSLAETPKVKDMPENTRRLFEFKETVQKRVGAKKYRALKKRIKERLKAGKINAEEAAAELQEVEKDWKEGLEWISRRQWLKKKGRGWIKGLSGARVDRLIQMATVSGKGGAKFNELVMELRGKISGIRSKATSYTSNIQEQMYRLFEVEDPRTGKLRGAENFNDLRLWHDEDLASEWNIPEDKTTGQIIEDDINMVLGVVEDDVLMDKYVPGARARILKEMAEMQSKVRSLYAKKIFEGKKLLKSEDESERLQGHELIRQGEAERTASFRPLKDAYMAEITDVYAQAAAAFKEDREFALTRLRQIDSRAAKKAGRKDPTELGNSLVSALLGMREAINELQKEIINSGILDDQMTTTTSGLFKNLNAKIKASFGIYLSSSYQGIDEGAYARWLESEDPKGMDPEAKRRWQMGYDYFENEVLDEHAARIAKVSEHTLGTAKVLAKRLNMAKRNEVLAKFSRFVNAFTTKGIGRGPTVGVMNAKVLEPKVVIDPVLREVMGLYTDNVYNAGRTLMNLGAMVSNHKFLQSVKTTLEGLQKLSVDELKGLSAAERGNRERDTPLVFISNNGEEAHRHGLRPFVPERGTTSVSGEHFGPLRGFYGPKYLVEALHEMVETRQGGGFAGNGMMKIASMSMANLTTRRFRTHVRNFTGNTALLFGAGMPVTAVQTLFNAVATGATAGFGVPGVTKRMAGSLAFRDAGRTGYLRDITRKLGGDKGTRGPSVYSEPMTELRVEYAERLITGQDVRTNIIKELRKSLEFGSFADPLLSDQLVPGTGGLRVRDFLDNMDELATLLYAAEDDFWKITNYEGQLVKLAKVFGFKKPRGRVGTTAVEMRDTIGRVNKGTGEYEGTMTDEQADAILKMFPPKTPLQQKLLKDSGKKVAALDALKDQASERVQLTMPNYSNTIDLIKQLKRHKITAVGSPFISWHGEIARIMVDTPKLALGEMSLGLGIDPDKHGRMLGVLSPRNIALGLKGQVTGDLENAAMYRMGVGRLLNYASTTALLPTFAVGTVALTVAAMAALTGDEEDDEENFYEAFRARLREIRDTKRFLSEWYQTGTIVVWGTDKDKGDVTFMDISNVLPHSTITDPLKLFTSAWFDPDSFVGTAMGTQGDQRSRAKRMWTAGQRAFIDLFDPFLTPQMWVSEFSKASDRDDPLREQELNPLFGRLFPSGVLPGGGAPDLGLIGNLTKLALIPGTVTDVFNVGARVIGGSKTVRGREVNLLQESMGAFLGQKIITTNIPDKFERRLKFRGQQLFKSKQNLRNVIRSGSTVSAADVRRAYEDYYKSWKQTLVSTRLDYTAAATNTRTGTNLAILMESNLPRSIQQQIAVGVMERPTPSDRDFRITYEEGIKLNNPGRVRALLEAVSKVPSVELLD